MECNHMWRFVHLAPTAGVAGITKRKQVYKCRKCGTTKHI